VIRYRTGIYKATEAALYALGSLAVPPERLLAVAFEADRIHVNLYGRPICGGEHRVASFGPASTSWCEAIGFLPNQRLLLPPPGSPFERRGSLVAGTRPFERDMMSKSDLSALDAAWLEVLAKGDGAQLLSFAVCRARDGRVAWEDVLEGRHRNPERIDDLASVGPYLVF
jgi:hypothetical protein